MEEIDFRLKLSQSGLNRVRNGQAMNNRIREWLATPEGTVADRPDWGHRMTGYRFDPESKDLAVMLEMSIIEKITTDVRDLTVRHIRVEFKELDLCHLTIDHSDGLFSEIVKLTG